MRVRLSYFDQNESLRGASPEGGVLGRIERRVALRDWGDNWCVLALEGDIEYEGRRHSQALIRSRWEGHDVGEKEQTSVFILLPRKPSVLSKTPLDQADFDHVAWGMARTESVV